MLASCSGSEVKNYKLEVVAEYPHDIKSYTQGLFFNDGKLYESTGLNGKPVRWLNELEYIDGQVWANVYTSDEIVIINPRSGNVEGVVDCAGLLPRNLHSDTTDVLNGIAYDPQTGKIYLTGKNWPKMYEIKLVEN